MATDTNNKGLRELRKLVWGTERAPKAWTDRGYDERCVPWMAVEALLASPTEQQGQGLTVQQIEDIHRIIGRWSTDVVDYEGATDDINAYLFGGIEQPESKLAHPSAVEESELRGLVEKFGERVQGFCFYWKETHRRGGCKERNGKYCVFCELSDELAALLWRGR